MIEVRSINTTLQSKLDMFVQVIPTIHAMLPDIGIGVANRTEWIAYYPGKKINIGAMPGRKIDPKEPLADCIRDNKPIKVEVPAHFFGISFTGLATPISENGEVIGAIAIQMQEQNERELRKISDQIFQSLTQANQRVTTIHNGAEGLAAVSQTLLAQSNQAVEAMNNTDEVIQFIKNIANKTNILGINASIEAAHAGEKGRGFNIVAKEIRKLSQDTLASTEKISNTLLQMQESIDEIKTVVEQVVSVGTHQAMSTEEVASFMNEIEEMSKKLNQYAAKL